MIHRFHHQSGRRHQRRAVRIDAGGAVPQGAERRQTASRCRIECKICVICNKNFAKISFTRAYSRKTYVNNTVRPPNTKRRGLVSLKNARYRATAVAESVHYPNIAEKVSFRLWNRLDNRQDLKNSRNLFIFGSENLRNSSLTCFRRRRRQHA